MRDLYVISKYSGFWLLNCDYLILFNNYAAQRIGFVKKLTVNNQAGNWET